jgi:hypothetical protein
MSSAYIDMYFVIKNKALIRSLFVNFYYVNYKLSQDYNNIYGKLKFVYIC